MVKFIFCVHIHQPVGNFDFVIEDACKNAYLPFLKMLSKYPSIKLSLHISGSLLDWLNENHPQYISLLKTLIKRGQVEIIGAGYYEPVLIALPEKDRISQIRLMSDKLYEHLGVMPRGLWLTERVWEPHLPKSLKEANVEYVVVDDYHFVKAGLKKEELSGYYITEEQGSILKVFPGSERLRYLIPFESQERFIEYLKEVEGRSAEGEAPLIIFADDGEKFGVWPGTYEWVYEKDWLEGFFETLLRNKWINPVTFSEYMDANEPSGRVYLPTTSYMEMGEWALPAEASFEYTNLANDVKTWQDGERIRRFLQGGIWRNFMAKYSEANWMHKRMLMVSKKMCSRESIVAASHLYKAQCNDAYWHGVFGGLYLPHLRGAVYENLIKAENVLEEESKLQSSIHKEDIDSDTHNEVIIKTKNFRIFIKPSSGGAIQEMDYLPNAYNLTNVLTRRYEGYHYRVKKDAVERREKEAKSIHDIVLSKEKGLESALVYDNYERRSLIDRFIRPGINLDTLQKGSFEELGSFVNGAYSTEPCKEGSKFILSCEGTAFENPVRIEKGLSISNDSILNIDYSIKNLGYKSITGLFGSEWNLLMGFGLNARDMGVMERFEIKEEWLGLKFELMLNPAAKLFIYPVETVSFSEAGLERNFQGLCILPCWGMYIEPGRIFSFELSINIQNGF